VASPKLDRETTEGEEEAHKKERIAAAFQQATGEVIVASQTKVTRSTNVCAYGTTRNTTVIAK
jgi:hypothetical protein